MFCCESQDEYAVFHFPLRFNLLPKLDILSKCDLIVGKQMQASRVNAFRVISQFLPVIRISIIAKCEPLLCRDSKY